MITSRYVIYGVITGLIIFIGVFIFRPVVQKVVGQKLTTLNLFLLVPRNVVVKMSKKTVKLQNILTNYVENRAARQIVLKFLLT